MGIRVTLSLVLCALLLSPVWAEQPGKPDELSKRGVSFDQKNLATYGALAMNNVNLEFRQTPLADALDTLLKDIGVSYTIDPSVNDLKVSAVLKNVSSETALREITKAAGAVYRIDGGVILISRVLQPLRPPAPPAPGGLGNEAMVIEVRNLSAGDIARVLPNFGASVMVVSGDKLVLSGSQEAIDKTWRVIEAIDVPQRAVRPVRVKVTMTVTLPGAKPYNASLSTESIGAEGRPAPLNLSSTIVLPHVTRETPNFIDKPIKMTLTLTPIVCEDGSINLTGSGHIGVAITKATTKPSAQQKGVVPSRQTIEKSFDVAVSAQPGKSVVLAAGSVDVDFGKASFEVSAVAVVEEGCLTKLPPVSEQPPAGGVHGSPGSEGMVGPNRPGRGSYGDSTSVR